MKFPFPIILSLLPAIFLHLPLFSTATPFVCTTQPAASCQSLIGYIPPNRTTYTALKFLFTVKSIRALFSANNLPLSTRASTSVPAGSYVRIPVPCSCSAGAGSSSGRPLYVVKPGDGLDFIARNIFAGFVTYQDIATASNISDPSLIKVGQRVLIPMPCSCDSVGGEPTVHYAHLVKAGSSVASIAEEFEVSQDVLLRLNGIKDPKTLQAGQVLDVPLRACLSSISNSSMDRNLLITKDSYVLTAKNCVLCSCSSSTWQLDCHPTQGISNTSCPAATCGSLLIGNTSVSACETSTCTYTGYTASSILTSLTNHSTCNGTNGLGPVPAPPQNNGSTSIRVKWLNGAKFIVLQAALFLFGLLWNEIN